MGNLFRKPAKEFTINEETLMISPLKVGTLLKIQGLTQSIAEAFAKLRSIIANDYEQIKNSTPHPTDGDKDAIEYVEKTTHKAPELSAISLLVKNKQEGLKALFDCLFQMDLLDDVFRSSVDKFRDIPKNALFDPMSEYALDVPTGLEILLAIVEVNAGGFSELGKFSRLLNIFQGAAKQAEPNAN